MAQRGAWDRGGTWTEGGRREAKLHPRTWSQCQNEAAPPRGYPRRRRLHPSPTPAPHLMVLSLSLHCCSSRRILCFSPLMTCSGTPAEADGSLLGAWPAQGDCLCLETQLPRLLVTTQHRPHHGRPPAAGPCRPRVFNNVGGGLLLLLGARCPRLLHQPTSSRAGPPWHLVILGSAS